MKCDESIIQKTADCQTHRKMLKYNEDSIIESYFYLLLTTVSIATTEEATVVCSYGSYKKIFGSMTELKMQCQIDNFEGGGASINIETNISWYFYLLGRL